MRDDLGQCGKFSVFAHIVSDELGGPRCSAVLSPKLAQDVSNLMLLASSIIGWSMSIVAEDG